MPRRLVLTAVASLSVLAAVASVPSASAAAPAAFPPAPPGPLPLPLLRTPDQFTITLSNPGGSGISGTYKLTCGPAGGTHPRAQAACDRLAQLAEDGRDPFAPVPEGAMCTMQHGGGATAHVTGSWQDHNVDATFNRRNGCEISRWQTLEPVLPDGRA